MALFIEGVHFVLRTDHANLTFLHSGYSAKVTRWRMEMQDYAFSLEHIPGRNNIVADAFSRMLETYEDESSTDDLSEQYPVRVLVSLVEYPDENLFLNCLEADSEPELDEVFLVKFYWSRPLSLIVHQTCKLWIQMIFVWKAKNYLRMVYGL